MGIGRDQNRITNLQRTLPGKVRQVLSKTEGIQQVVRELVERQHVPVALEGALKCKEVAYLHAEGAYPVEADLEKVQSQAAGVFATCLANNQAPLKHEPERIAEAVLSMAGLGRDRTVPAGSNGHRARTSVPDPMVLNPAPRV